MASNSARTGLGPIATAQSEAKATSFQARTAYWRACQRSYFRKNSKQVRTPPSIAKRKKKAPTVLFLSHKFSAGNVQASPNLEPGLAQKNRRLVSQGGHSEGRTNDDPAIWVDCTLQARSPNAVQKTGSTPAIRKSHCCLTPRVSSAGANASKESLR